MFSALSACSEFKCLFVSPRPLSAPSAFDLSLSPRREPAAEEGEDIADGVRAVVVHVAQAAIAGADCATLPPQTFRDMFKHPLTDKGLETFLSDWKSTGQSIL